MGVIEMSKEIIEMMGKMMEQMTEMKSEMDARFDKMDARFDSVDARFDKMDTHFDSVEEEIKVGFHGVGKQFEELTKDIIALEKDSKRDTNYLRVKVSQLEQEVFIKDLK